MGARKPCPRLPLATPLLAAALASSLAGCASVGYAILQEPDTPHARSRCEAIHNRSLRERCHARIVPPYEEYERQREELSRAVRAEIRCRELVDGEPGDADRRRLGCEEAQAEEEAAPREQ